MFSMLGGIWQSITDFFVGIFAFIPQFMYFLYASIASVLDMLQFLVRKLAGLDSYTVAGQQSSGDILTRFISGILGLNDSYSALSTVFWALVIFGAIILILGTIIAIIKAHYNSDAKKTNPMAILSKAGKALATFAIVPIVTILGLYTANALLRALDTITAQTSASDASAAFGGSSATVSEVFEAGQDEWAGQTYTNYDFFSLDAPTGCQTFSGIMFKTAAFNANRVRSGLYTASTAGDSWSDLGIFNSNKTGEAQVEDVASMIDYAFANNMHLKNSTSVSVLKSETWGLIGTFRYLISKVWYAGTINFNSFSKFNVGLVWYYYNLWNFNFLVGFIGIIMMVTFLTNIVFGLAVRILEGTALFLCLAPIVAMMPLDNESAFKTWRKEFTGDVIMAYGAIAGLNLVLLLLPYLQRIDFFNGKDFLNGIMNSIVIIVALMAMKQLVQLISNFIGGKNANETGKESKQAIGEIGKKAAEKAGAAIALGAKVAKFIPGVSAAAKAVDEGLKKVREIKAKIAREKAANKAAGEKTNVSASTFEQLKKERMDELDNEEKAHEGDEKEANEKYQEADEQEDLAKEENKAAEEADTEQMHEDFEAWLKADDGTDFQGAKDADDVARANAIREEYQSTIVARGHMRGSKMTRKKFARQFAEGSVKHHRENAQNYTEQAQTLRQEGDDKMADLNRIRQQKKTVESDLSKTYNVRKPIVKQTLMEFGGQTLKFAGSMFGIDDMLQKLKNETQAADYGKMALREFAQQLNIPNYQSKEIFQTQRQRQEYLRDHISEMSGSDKVSEAQLEVNKQIRELSKEFSHYKVKKESEKKYTDRYITGKGYKAKPKK